MAPKHINRITEKKFTILPEQMRALARYEDTFEKYMEDGQFPKTNLVFPEKYQMTLEDLYFALKNILEREPTDRDLLEYWFSPLCEMKDEFGINRICHEPNGIDDSNGSDDCEVKRSEWDTDPYLARMLLPITEEYVFHHAWNSLCSDSHEVKPSIQNIELFFENKKKPFLEWEFAEADKKRFVFFFTNNEWLKRASEIDLQLCRKFTDEFCEKDERIFDGALYLKGYSCFGGNQLYECDWEASRDCMQCLFNLHEGPEFALLLGYIYYYGRCTEGIPDYEKAFEMFLFAAAHSLHEGAYMLGDMFSQGYACRKSLSAAAGLYKMAYQDSLAQFLNVDSSGQFAEAALRMGNAYQKGIGVPKDKVYAYTYYLQADYAARLRRQENPDDFFRKANEDSTIHKALNESRAELPENFFREYTSDKYYWQYPRITDDWPLGFWAMVDKGHRAEISFTAQKDDVVRIKVKRLPFPTRLEADPLLLTYPEIDYCKLTTEIELLAYQMKTSFDMMALKPFQYDNCISNLEKNRYEFYFAGVLRGWISCDEYRLYRQ